MHLWRNRQTRQIQVLVGATRCRFDSCQVHQKKAKSKDLAFFSYIRRAARDIALRQ